MSTINCIGSGCKADSMMARILAKDAEITALRADAARLKWIEEKLFEHKWNGVIDSGSRTNWSIAGDFRHTTQRMIGCTFRDAIDAARGTA